MLTSRIGRPCEKTKPRVSGGTRRTKNTRRDFVEVDGVRLAEKSASFARVRQS